MYRLDIIQATLNQLKDKKILYNGNYIYDELITSVSTLVVKPIINALLPFLHYFTFFFNHDNPKKEVINKLIYFKKANRICIE